MSRKEEIKNTLVFLAEEAYADQIEALFCVDVRLHNSGEAFTTVHSLADWGTDEQVAKVTEHLRGIADVLREIYAGREEVKR